MCGFTTDSVNINMSICSPLLQENDSYLYLEGSDSFFVLETSNDCAKEISGGTVIPAPNYYTPVPERIVWLRVKYKDSEWEQETRLPTFEMPYANEKVSVMFKPSVRQKIVSEAKVTLKKVSSSKDSKAKGK